MNFDLRLPLGLVFTLFGALLVAHGMTTGPEVYRRSLDINVNLVWGAVMLAFGAAMLALAWRARRLR